MSGSLKELSASNAVKTPAPAPTAAKRTGIAQHEEARTAARPNAAPPAASSPEGVAEGVEGEDDAESRMETMSGNAMLVPHGDLSEHDACTL